MNKLRKTLLLCTLTLAGGVLSGCTDQLVGTLIESLEKRLNFKTSSENKDNNKQIAVQNSDVEENKSKTKSFIVSVPSGVEFTSGKYTFKPYKIDYEACTSKGKFSKLCHLYIYDGYSLFIGNEEQS